MRHVQHALFLVWLGLWGSVEQTTIWSRLFADAGVSTSASAIVGLNKRTEAYVIYIQPITGHDYRPAIQVGAAVRLF